jgi:hypothetical protein
VQLFQLALQLDQVLAMDKIFYQFLVMTFLAVRQAFNQAMTIEELDHLGETLLQAFLRFLGFNFSHGALHPSQRTRQRGHSNITRRGDTDFG